jgi:hypothetical protein
MRTEFARVYVLVNVHSLDLWCQKGGGEGGCARVLFPMSARKMDNLSRNPPGAESQGDCIC